MRFAFNLGIAVQIFVFVAILGYIFFPIVWLMGVPLDEVMTSAELLGIKTALNEFVAYAQLSGLEEGALSDRSKLITLYALCGFANFSSIGILVSLIFMFIIFKNTLVNFFTLLFLVLTPILYKPILQEYYDPLIFLLIFCARFFTIFGFSLFSALFGLFCRRSGIKI